MKVKGVILAAGYGSRFLPVTRAVPKELLPLVDRPCLDFVVAELAEAGVTELLVITSARKGAVEDWFRPDPVLEAAFAAHPDKLDLVRPRADVQVSFARQARMGGTGHALLLARDFAGDDPVLVCYPDDLFGEPNPTAQLLDVYARTERTVLAARDMGPGADVSRWGVFDVAEADGFLALRRFVEKPPPGTEPSTLVSLGRFLYTPEIFPLLERRLAAHTGGEFYHVGAVEDLAAADRVAVCPVTAPHRDTGTPAGYLRTAIEVALAHPGIGPDLRAWLAARLASPEG